MPVTGSGKRYAQAVFEITQERNEFEEWQSSLRRIIEVAENKELLSLLESPKLPFITKQALIKEPLEGANPLALNLAYLLAAKGRLRITAGIAAEYKRLLNLHYGIEVVEVTTAVPLDSEDQKKLRYHLGTITGKEVVINLKLEPAILGGVIIKVGDRLIDGSTKSRLKSLRKSLMESER